MKDIRIRITGKQFIGDDTEEKMEFITEGKMSNRNGAYYFMYDESEFSGFPGCKTVLKLVDNESLKMKRIGGSTGYGAELVFSKGEKFTNSYITPYGTFDMEVMTENFTSNFDEAKGGSISIDYHVIFSDLAEGYNKLKIDILM